MTTYKEQQKRWAALKFRPPTGAGRCSACSWHIPTMNHVPGCPLESKYTVGKIVRRERWRHVNG